MKFLATLLAFMALAQCAFAQFSFPLTSLTISAADATSFAGVSGTGIKPNFGAYRNELLRYAAEFTYSNTVTLTFTWSGASVVNVRNCGSTLNLPTVSRNSHCYFNAATAATGGSSTIQNIFPGSTYIELSVDSTINGGTYTFLYVIAVGVYSASGTNMLTLGTEDVFSDFNTPYTMQTSQYTITYAVDQGSSTTSSSVPFYFSAQTSVTTVFVQECAGVSCTNCDVSALSQRQVIAGVVPSGFSAINQGQLDLSNGNLGLGSTATFPKHGKYYFNAAINAPNCVRFINRVDAGAAGTNDYTITIQLNMINCGAYTTCQSCVNVAYCGWCNNNQFNVNSGACHIGTDSFSITGSSCFSSNTFLVATRWIWNANTAPNDPSTCVGGLRGDPRISGLQGQDFQVHGTPNEYFNLVSTPSLQVNSRFVFLDEAKCDNFTACFTHPGTYIDEIGVMMGENKVRLAAGAIAEAARVFINGKEVSVSAHKHSAGQVTVTFANARRVVIKTPEFMMTVSQSDKFFNVESALLKTELLDQGSKLVKLSTSRAAEANTVMHGLIGQTWRNNVYAGEREYEGEVSDYQVADGIWGKDFAFNLYQN